MRVVGPIEQLEARRLLSGLSIIPEPTSPIDEGHSAQFSFAIDDPSASAAHQYTIDWGDSSQFTSEVFAGDVLSFTTPAHTYRNNGPAPAFAFGATITVTSLDETAQPTDEAIAPVEQVVNNLPPRLAAGAFTLKKVTEGQPLSFEYLQIDPGLDDTITVTVDWGDGDITTDLATRVNRPPAGFDSNPTKPTPYARAGTYPLTITSHDDAGGDLVEHSSVIVSRQFAIAGDDSTLADSQYQLALSTTNPDLDDVNWLIDWGDGSAVQQVDATMSSAADLVVGHEYSGPTSIGATITATPSEASIPYPKQTKPVDVLGTVPAIPTLFGIEVSGNTQAGLSYQSLRQAKIVWNSVVPARLDSFTIQRSDDGDSDWTMIASALAPDASGTNSFTDVDLPHTEFYRVIASYNDQDSQPSPVFAARMDADYALVVGATAEPSQITVRWTAGDAATAGFVLYRKSPSANVWTLLDSFDATVSEYVDHNVTNGVSYEYRVDRLNIPHATSSPENADRAFILAGSQIPLADTVKRVILVIAQPANDEPDVAAGIDTLERDLISERFLVTRLYVAESDDPFAAHTIRNQLVQIAAGSVQPIAAIMLIGHVPAPFSGHGGYDQHNPGHLGAWSTDTYFGDLSIPATGGQWTDSEDLPGGDRPANQNLAGDGRFDNDVVPDAIEIPVGRIDFFEPIPNRAVEFDRLASYLARDHAYRTGQIAVTDDAVIDVRRERGGSRDAIPQYTTFGSAVGRGGLLSQSLYSASQNPNDVHRFGAMISHGGWDRLFDPNEPVIDEGNLYYYFFQFPIRSVFNVTTGSLSGDFYSYQEDSNRYNVMRQVLASGNALTDVWVGFTSFEMHSMGLGETVGQAWLRTINGAGVYDRPGLEGTTGSITLNLLGDPTLPMRPVPPANDLSSASDQRGRVHLHWSPSANATSYRVYRAVTANGPFELVGETSATNFDDSSPRNNRVYMVRALLLEQSTTGSYLQASDGAMATITGWHITSIPVGPVKPKAPPPEQFSTSLWQQLDPADAGILG